MPALSKPFDAPPRRLLVIVRCTRLRGGGCGASTPAQVDDDNASSHPSLGKPPMRINQMTSSTSNARYTEPAIVFELASTGDVRLLSFNWLAERAKSGQ